MTRNRFAPILVAALLLVTSGSAVAVTTASPSTATQVTVHPPETHPSQSIETRPQNETTNATANVTFRNQTIANESVNITSATLPDGGFVAIHTTELLNATVLDSIVGVSEYVEPGTHDNVTVALDETAPETERLIAVLYRDTDGDGAFEFVSSQGSVDDPYTIDHLVATDAAVVEASDE